MNLRHLVELLRRQGTEVEVAGELGALDQEVLSVTNRTSEAGPQVVLVVEPTADPSTVDQALRRGVAAVVAEEPLASPVPVLRVRQAREAFRHLLAVFYGEPAKKLLLWGVTGPGKTSAAFLLHRCLDAGRFSTGLWADALGPGPFHHQSGFPAGLLLFLRHLVERGGQAAILSLCPAEPLSYGVALAGLIALDHRCPAWLQDASAAPLLVLPSGRRPPVGDARRFFTFGPGPAADLRYRRLWATLRGQEVEFTAQPRLLTGIAGVAPVPLTWRARLATPGPATRRVAAAATAAALLFGVPPSTIASALADFPGVYRRCQLVYDGEFAILDDVAQSPREAAATLAALTELEAEARQKNAARPYRILRPVCAVAGGRGAAHNAALGRSLAQLLPRFRVERLIVTESLAHTPPEFQPTREERAALLAACRQGGLPVEYYPDLGDALASAVRAARRGDLLLLMGGPGMNQGQALLADLLAARGLALEEPFDEWLTGPLLRPLSLAELTRRDNLPGSVSFSPIP
ncbi:MAG: glutamate ligase domain-containing protein [Betaproteobacteria bacterium]